MLGFDFTEMSCGGAIHGPWVASGMAGGCGLARKGLCTMLEFNKCRGLPPLALAPLCAPHSEPHPTHTHVLMHLVTHS